ncbi:MAG: TSUP family transporter [Polyangiales bacterium]
MVGDLVPIEAVFTAPPLTIALLAVVALLAGVVDAIGGGGGLLTVPSLLAAGLPTHLALGTNKGCSTWGTAAATFTFARAGKLGLRRGAIGFLGGATGAIAGAKAQLAFAPDALKPIVLVLLVVAAVTLAVYRPKARAPLPSGESELEDSVLAPLAIALVLGAYDGFFGPGTGTFVIVAHATFLGAPLSMATADAKAVNLGSNVASLTTFALRGTVLWAIALPMAAGNILGNVIGARLAVRGGDRTVRYVVIAVSLALVAKLAWDVVGH